MDGDTVESAAGVAGTAAAPGEWAMVEIMGHRRHAGRIREVARFGAALLEIAEFGRDDAAPWRVQYFSGAAIFSIRPLAEAEARRICDDDFGFLRQPAAPRLALVGAEDPARQFDDIDPAEEEKDAFPCHLQRWCRSGEPAEVQVTEVIGGEGYLTVICLRCAEALGIESDGTLPSADEVAAKLIPVYGPPDIAADLDIPARPDGGAA